MWQTERRSLVPVQQPQRFAWPLPPRQPAPRSVFWPAALLQPVCLWWVGITRAGAHTARGMHVSKPQVGLTRARTRHGVSRVRALSSSAAQQHAGSRKLTGAVRACACKEHNNTPRDGGNAPNAPGGVQCRQWPQAWTASTCGGAHRRGAMRKRGPEGGANYPVCEVRAGSPLWPHGCSKHRRGGIESARRQPRAGLHVPDADVDAVVVQPGRHTGERACTDRR